MQREKRVCFVCSFGVFCNLVLFLIKLYVSLSSNSISIFSDGINNLTDSVSCLLAVICMACALNLSGKGKGALIGKTEQILSFVLAVAVGVVGASFAYSSLERFMYPTPVWFAVRYFALIAATAAVKLLMFFFYRFEAKKTGSPVIKVMAVDSITDFFVTLVTLVTFTMTNFTKFTVDAAAGLFISIIIIVQAVKLIKKSLCALMGIVPKEKRLFIEQTARQFFEDDFKDIVFVAKTQEEFCAFVELEKSAEQQKQNEFCKTCFEQTGIETLVAGTAKN